MKKILSVLLCVSMLLGYGVLAVNAADDELIVNVVTDIHYDKDAQLDTVPVRNTISETFPHVAEAGKLYSESEAIIDAFLKKAAADSSEVILVPGDLADTGVYQEMIAVAKMFSKFEETTGKQIYVVPGNHDVSQTDVSQFIKVFAEFGYNEAIAKDSNSGSYVAELPNGYRLLAIDSTLTRSGNWGFDEARSEWIRQQAEKAQKDGKKVIAMMHHNLLEHYIFGEKIHSGGMVNYPDFADLLADNGVKFIFTGHTHDQDIKEYKSANGNTIYDVVTNTLNAYPCTYREVTFAKDVTFTAKYVDKIDTALLPAGLSEEAVALAGSDFTQYTKTAMWTGLRTNFRGYTNAATLIKFLKLEGEENAEMQAIITKVGDKLSEVVEMPFYKKDANGGTSLEDIAVKYGKTLPASSYTDLIDLVITLYQAHCLGDESYSASSVEIQLTTNAIATVLCYCLEDVSAEEYTAVLKFAATFAGAEVPDNLLSFAGDSMSRIKGIDLIVSLVFRPLATEFTTDDAPADNNVTLTGYRELSDFEKFIQSIRDFFQKIMDFFAKLFAF